MAAGLPTPFRTRSSLGAGGAKRRVVLADNQEMTSVDDGSSRTIYSDPVPLGDANRATASFNFHYAFGGALGFTMAFQTETSLDGTNWVTQGPSFSTSTLPPVTPMATAAVNGAFMRMKFVFFSGGAGRGAIDFDVHVDLERA